MPSRADRPLLEPALRNLTHRRRDQLNGLRLTPVMLSRLTERAGERLATTTQRLRQSAEAPNARRRDRFTALSQRLDNGRARVLADARRDVAKGRERLLPLTERLSAAFKRSLTRREEALERLDRMRISLGYTQTLARGFAVVRDDKGHVLTSAEVASKSRKLLIEFGDGELPVRPDSDPQGSLF